MSKDNCIQLIFLSGICCNIQGGIKIHKKLHRAAKFRPGQPHGIVQRNVNGVAKLSEIYMCVFSLVGTKNVKVWKT